MVNNWEYSTYSKINPTVKEKFPFEKPRKHQLETISEIKEAIDKGYKYIVLEAGTGTGKSVIAATLALMFDSNYILTVTKQLQDQYLQDFKKLGFKLVKGRSNFKCKKYAEDNLDYNCDEGRCVIEGYRCEYSLNRNHDDITYENTCHYYYQKFVAMNSSVVISNYPYMFLELNYVEDFKKRKLMIFDEAHNLENTIMNQLKLEFKRKELNEYNIDFSMDLINRLQNGDYIDWIRFIKRVKGNYSHELNKIKDLKGNSGIGEKISFLKLRINDCNNFIDHINHDPSKWIFDFDARFGVIEFKPIKVDNYAKTNLFKYADVCLFMSATILDYKLFAKWLGIDENEIYAIRRESPFNVDRNPIKTYDDFNLGYGNLITEAPKTISTLNEILEFHKNDKGIIHTISHQCKKFLMKSLSSPRLLDHNTYNRAKQLEKFKKSSEPLVFISPSMNEGVDLPGEQCRFQIIYKIPYPSLADKQTKERKNLDNQWYDYKTALALVQTYGRGMRYEQDYCRTYFIDNRLNGFIARDRVTNNFLPKFFREAINIVPAEIDSNEEVKFESVELKTELIKEDFEENHFIEETIVDDVSYYEKVKIKFDLYCKGKDLLSEDKYNEAIEFYSNLLNHELFINDYHPYLKLSQAYRGAGKYNMEIEIISEFFESGRYCRNNTIKWFKKRLKELEELGYYDFSQFNELERKYNKKGKKNRKFVHKPIPWIVDLKIGLKNNNEDISSVDSSIFDEFVELSNDLSYDDKIKFKYKLIKYGDELISKKHYKKAIAYYQRLLSHELFINDYHPYLKLVKLYGKKKQKGNQVEIILKFFKSGVYCSDKKLKWFKSRLRELSKYGLFDPSRIKELESEFYENAFFNKGLADKPVPIALKIRDLFESEEEESFDLKSSEDYSQKYFNQLAKEISQKPEYESYADLTKHKIEDYTSFEDYEKINKKFNLKNHGKKLESEDYRKAIDFYDNLKDNELFKYDYYPYRRQCIIFKNHLHNDKRDWQTILEIFGRKIYLNNHQYTWLNNKIIELIDKLNLKQEDINKINSLLESYEINKDNYQILQNNFIPIAERIFKDEKGLHVLSKEKYDFIENIHYINELGTGYIRRGDYETAIIFYSKMLKQNILYFKCRAYKSFARILKEMKDNQEFKRLYQKYMGNSVEYKK